MHGISNGDTKFVFGANGNVGIGTTNPNVAVDSTNCRYCNCKSQVVVLVVEENL